MLEDSVGSICRHENIVYLVYVVVHNLNHMFGFSECVTDCGTCYSYTVGYRYSAAQRIMVTYVVLNWPRQILTRLCTHKRQPHGRALGYLLWGFWRVTASHYISENWCSLPWVPLIYGRCSWHYRPWRIEPNRTPRTIESNDGVSSHEIYEQQLIGCYGRLIPNLSVQLCYMTSNIYDMSLKFSNMESYVSWSTWWSELCLFWHAVVSTSRDVYIYIS